MPRLYIRVDKLFSLSNPDPLRNQPLINRGGCNKGRQSGATSVELLSSYALFDWDIRLWGACRPQMSTSHLQ